MTDLSLIAIALLAGLLLLSLWWGWSQAETAREDVQFWRTQAKGYEDLANEWRKVAANAEAEITDLKAKIIAAAKKPAPKKSGRATTRKRAGK